MNDPLQQPPVDRARSRSVVKSPVVSPCSVFIDRVVLDHSFPVGRPRSRSVKRRAATISSDSEDEDVIPPMPKRRMAGPQLDGSGSEQDISDQEEDRRRWCRYSWS